MRHLAFGDDLGDCVYARQDELNCGYSAEIMNMKGSDSHAGDSLITVRRKYRGSVGVARGINCTLSILRSDT